jgi:hypothetical protein
LPDLNDIIKNNIIYDITHELIKITILDTIKTSVSNFIEYKTHTSPKLKVSPPPEDNEVHTITYFWDESTID